MQNLRFRNKPGHGPRTQYYTFALVSAAETIYNYLRLNQEVTIADAILVLYSNNLRVARRAAELFLERKAPLLIVSRRAISTLGIY